jgi:thiol-disulfide isomerase/thioredoxin
MKNQMIWLWALLWVPSGWLASAVAQDGGPQSVGSATKRVQNKVLAKSWAEIERSLHQSDTLFVVNIWATWCKPCVAEMPYFEQYAQERSHQPVKVIFLSADDPEETATLTQPLVDRKRIQNAVWVINETNPNNWIPRVDPNWQGDIPATLLVRNGKKIAFHNGEFDLESLRTFVDKHLQN